LGPERKSQEAHCLDEPGFKVLPALKALLKADIVINKEAYDV